MKKIKKFLKKNSFIVILMIAVLIAGTNYLIYPVFIKSNLSLSDVPIALKESPEGTMITDDMIGVISIDKSFLPEGIVMEKDEIVDHYSKIDHTIPVNSFLYSDSLSEAEEVYGPQYGKLSKGKYAFDIVNNGQISLIYDIKNQIIKEGMNINVYYRQQFINSNKEEAYYVGLLAEECKVVNVDSDTITIAVNEEDLPYLITAQAKGTLIPLTSWQSTMADWSNTVIFDISQTKDHLRDDYGEFFTRQDAPIVEYQEHTAETDAE